MARVIVFGEILWDCLPSGPRLGGAPLNAAANLSLLGNEVFLISAVGNDDFGKKALELLQKYKVNTDFVKQCNHPTGTVEVSLDEQGDASYAFTPNCAWHHIGDLLNSTQMPEGDALLYGSLANHTPNNWSWLENQMNNFNGVKFCDINLREPWDQDVVKSVALTSNILKCNETEYEQLTGNPASIEDTRLLRKAKEDDPKFPKNLCVTFGKEGALYFSEKNEIYSGTANAVEVIDSIGAGDAFLAGLIHQYLTHADELPIPFLNICCQLGAEAASRSGALPELC